MEKKYFKQKKGTIYEHRKEEIICRKRGNKENMSKRNIINLIYSVSC